MNVLSAPPAGKVSPELLAEGDVEDHVDGRVYQQEEVAERNIYKFYTMQARF